MMRLDLTHTEADHLQQALSHLVAQSTSEEVVVAYQGLLAKLATACQQVSVQQLCPVCQREFTSRNTRRLALYCSNACKQKAYRQRCLERKRRWRPERRRKSS
jgi:hypothetical protein